MVEREGMMARLEDAGCKMRESGVCEQWFCGVDPEIRAVAGDANGQLFAALLQATGYVDCACVDLLRDGMRPL